MRLFMDKTTTLAIEVKTPIFKVLDRLAGLSVINSNPYRYKPEDIKK